MAVITPTILAPTTAAQLGNFITGIAPVVLGASDTFQYAAGTGQFLVLRNPTGGTVTPIIDGADGVNFPVDGWGVRAVGPGLTLTALTTLQVRIIPLDTILAYLQGTITITSGTGLQAWLFNPVA